MALELAQADPNAHSLDSARFNAEQSATTFSDGSSDALDEQRRFNKVERPQQAHQCTSRTHQQGDCRSRCGSSGLEAKQRCVPLAPPAFSHARKADICFVQCRRPADPYKSARTSRSSRCRLTARRRIAWLRSTGRHINPSHAAHQPLPKAKVGPPSMKNKKTGRLGRQTGRNTCRRRTRLWTISATSISPAQHSSPLSACL